jgi:hypothetical protein
VPPGSRWAWSGSALLGAKAIVRARVTTAAAAVATRTEPHQNDSTSAPEPRKPTTPPMVAAAAHSPMAIPRRSAGNTAVMVASVAGKISAAPAPAAMRAASS